MSIEIYKLYFNSFEGSSTGKLSFEISEVTTSVIEGNNDYSGKFTVYPNVISSNENVNISMDLPNHGDFKISIVDMLGQSIVTKNLSAVNSFDTYTLQNLNLSQGMYFVTITTANGTGSQKLIVE